ncbi:MAG TPA: phosphate ABC transporter permease subunit PstC [Candidatus Dormibacteraeota bacterium]|nr:phosphate ABC transporter permease subunit PstC [Candidatus Dormibacteraeota bacterium]
MSTVPSAIVPVPSLWRRRLRAERVSRIGFAGAAALSLVVVALVILFLTVNAWPAFIHIGLDNFFGSATWDPDGATYIGGRYGALTPIAGSAIAVGLALVIAIPVGLALAITLAETSRNIGERVFRPAIELFVGVPSIVYGYVGLVLLVPQLEKVAPPGKAGFGFAAAGIVLGVMVVPTIATLSADAIQSVPSTLREGSTSLGATAWQTLIRVVFPAARPGIISSIVLGFARAMGEALAVALVIGNVAQIPSPTTGLSFLFYPTMTMTTTITDGISNLGANPKAEAARYMLALVLLLITFGCVSAIRFAQRRSEMKL